MGDIVSEPPLASARRDLIDRIFWVSSTVFPGATVP
jgi:hypothetical protein